MKRIIFLVGIVFILILLFSFRFPLKSTLHLPSKNISLEIVDTPQAREQGLSGRKNLPDDTAMLFVFDTPDKYKFWMKDMKFPIDIIWLDPLYKIVYIESAVFPETYPETFEPAEKSLYVLEANAHFAEKNKLKVGDILQLDLKK